MQRATSYQAIPYGVIAYHRLLCHYRCKAADTGYTYAAQPVTPLEPNLIPFIFSHIPVWTVNPTGHPTRR